MARLLISLFFVLLVTRSVSVFSLSCTQVIGDMMPCLSFLQGRSENPSRLCCNGMKALKAVEKTKSDRVASCSCGKRALSLFKYDPNNLPRIPKLCGVDIDLPAIDKNYNCDKVSA